MGGDENRIFYLLEGKYGGPGKCWKIPARQVYKINHKISLEKRVKSYHFRTISRIHPQIMEKVGRFVKKLEIFDSCQV